ncbi:unnamed protein product [Symbiodinium sp. CCMP2592]|nr:unnamed protein product [Symbiodinium sp. CCMP2592]
MLYPMSSFRSFWQMAGDTMCQGHICNCFAGLFLVPPRQPARPACFQAGECRDAAVRPSCQRTEAGGIQVTEAASLQDDTEPWMCAYLQLSRTTGSGDQRFSSKEPNQSAYVEEERAHLTSRFPQFAKVVADFLRVNEYAQFRATSCHAGEELHFKAMVDHFLGLMQVSRPDAFAATGAWSLAHCSEQFWQLQGGEGFFLQAAKEGFVAFFGGIDKICKASPKAMVAVANSLRVHCHHPRADVARQVQQSLIVAAGCLFEAGDSKAVRHLFAVDMVAALHQDAEVQLETCRALARCSPRLLGRFNKGVAKGLLRVLQRSITGITAGRSTAVTEACFVKALEALGIFVRHDAALIPLVYSHLLHVFRCAPRFSNTSGAISNILRDMEKTVCCQVWSKLVHSAEEAATRLGSLTLRPANARKPYFHTQLRASSRQRREVIFRL